MSQDYNNNRNEELNTGLKVLSFCIPIVGAVLYFVYKGEKPKKAESACHAALWGFGLGILLNILGTVAGVA